MGEKNTMITETCKLEAVKGPTFLEPHSLAIRIWHWALVVFIFGAVTTVVPGFQPTTAEESNEKKHYLTIKWTYVVFYILILVMASTGPVLAFENVPFFQQIRRPVKSVHSFTQYLIYAFALLHIAGVVPADNLHYPGLVSRMIGGGKT